MSYDKTLRVLEKSGWDTKEVEALPENALTAEEIDSNFLNLEEQIEGKAASSHTHETLTRGTGLTGDNYNGGTAGSWAVDIASDANIRAGAASKMVAAAELYSANAPVALTDAATIAVDFNAGRNFTVALEGDRVLGNPTNQVAGQSGLIIVTQVTSARTLSYASNWIFASGAPDLTEEGKDAIVYYVQAGGTILAAMIHDYQVPA